MSSTQTDVKDISEIDWMPLIRESAMQDAESACVCAGMFKCMLKDGKVRDGKKQETIDTIKFLEDCQQLHGHRLVASK